MMIETEENRMEIEAKERVVFDVSRYYGDEGREVSAMDLMEREGIDESELLARFTEDDIFCYAMDLLDVDLQEEMDCLALYFDEASSRSYGGPNAYGNPNAGNRIVVQGSSRTWRGSGSGMEVYEDFRRAIDNAPSYRMFGNVFADCEMQKVWDENGSLFLTGAHHDGGVSVDCIRVARPWRRLVPKVGRLPCSATDGAGSCVFQKETAPETISPIGF